MPLRKSTAEELSRVGMPRWRGGSLGRFCTLSPLRVRSGRRVLLGCPGGRGHRVGLGCFHSPGGRAAPSLRFFHPIRRMNGSIAGEGRRVGMVAIARSG